MSDENDEPKNDETTATDEPKTDENAAAEERKKKEEEADETMRKLEEGDDVPTDPSDWPSGAAKYRTFGVNEDEPFGEGLSAKLGPGDVKRDSDGSVEIKGEKVDNPDDHRGEPIKGGPTDPDRTKLPWEKRMEEKHEERDEDHTPGEDEEGDQDAAEAAKKRDEKATQTMRDLEEGDPPKDPADWPSDAAKYKTYGVDEDEAYGEGLTEKLGPSDVKRFSDGSVEVKGEMVDNPDDYKGDPVPGGPTDPNSPALAGEERKKEEGGSQG
jgi:hypothetical protein